MTSALAREYDQLPDRAAVVWQVLLELGLSENTCLLVPARVLSAKTNLSPWNVAYGLGFLSLTGRITYQVTRDHACGERLYRVSLKGHLLPSSAPDNSPAQLLTDTRCRISFLKTKRVSEGLERGEEGGISAGADLSTDLVAVLGITPDFSRQLMTENSADALRSALKIAKDYPPERIRKNRIAIFFTILNRKSYAGGNNRPRSRSGHPDGTKSIDALYSESQPQRRLDLR